MRKIRIFLMSAAVFIAVSTALAGKNRFDCVDSPQFYKTSAGGYSPAGEFGVDYFCWNTAGVCTYYRPNPIGQPNTYLPCRLGTFQLVFLDSQRWGR